MRKKNTHSYNQCTEFTCHQIRVISREKKIEIEWKLHDNWNFHRFLLEIDCFRPPISIEWFNLFHRKSSSSRNDSWLTTSSPLNLSWFVSLVIFQKRKQEPFISRQKSFRFTISTFILIDWCRALWLALAQFTWALSHCRSETHQSVNISTLIGILHRLYKSIRIASVQNSQYLHTWISIYVFITHKHRCTKNIA